MKFEYHVKPTGNDAACGNAEHPFATIFQGRADGLSG